MESNKAVWLSSAAFVVCLLIVFIIIKFDITIQQIHQEFTIVGIAARFEDKVITIFKI
jgi:hypothetical protein